MCTLYNIASVIKSRRLRWAGHTAHMRNEKTLKALVGYTEV